MIGVIIGDIAGSRYEFHNYKGKDFELFSVNCFPTDDSIMSLAVASALLKSKRKIDKLTKNAVAAMRAYGKKYPFAGYGGRFAVWLKATKPEPYSSFGNGSAMRVSACAYAASSLDEALAMSDVVTGVTHNHQEGIKGARAVTEAIYMALHGSNIIDIQECIRSKYYTIDFKLDDIRDSYSFDVSCQGSVPQALEAFFESSSFEDAIRNAVSIGGDSDTIAAIAGSVAEAYYGVPAELRKAAIGYLGDDLLKVLNDFECTYGYPAVKTVEETDVKVFVRPVAKKSDERQRAMLIADTLDIEPEKMTSQQMFSHLYKACDIMRGPINQDDYKTYLLPLLFFKRISDVYDEEKRMAEEKYGDIIDMFDEEDLHKFIIPDGCHWNDVREVSENVGEAIINAMMGIESANPETMAGLFSSFDEATWSDKNKFTDERLKNLIEHMSQIRVGNNDYSADIMGNAYEYLLKQFADLSKKTAGEFFTPRFMVRLCVLLLDPKPGDTCADMASGSGGMLIECIRHINSEKDVYGKMFAQEKKTATAAICRINMFLHGASDFKMVQGDTLREPGFTEGDRLKTFKKIIMNPPFSLKKWGAEAFASDKWGRNKWGCPTDSNGDFAWLQHIVASMDEKEGKAVIILPQGVLFRSNQEAKIREELIKSDKLEAVIALAGGLFYSTGVSACILVLNNNKPAERKGKVILVDATKNCTPLRAQTIMTEDNVSETFKLYTDYVDKIDYAKVVTIDELADKGYTLSVNNYIEKPKAETVDPKKVKEEYFEALDAVKAAEAKLKKLLVEGGYLDAE